MVGVIFITYERTDYALATITGIKENLPGVDLGWYIADDGSNGHHLTAVKKLLNGDHVLGWHSQKLNYGGSANLAWNICTRQGINTTLWIEEDWQLRQKIDISPYVRLLELHDSVGMIRLGHMPVGQEAESIGIDGRMYLRLQKTRQYAFSGNPHLKHVRYRQAYGDYAENKNPGDTEIDYDWKFRSKGDGPDIIWPLAIGDNFWFHHIGERQSYD